MYRRHDVAYLCWSAVKS